MASVEDEIRIAIDKCETILGHFRQPGRNMDIVCRRTAVIRCLRNDMNLSLKKISKYLSDGKGQMHHSTVIHSLRKKNANYESLIQWNREQIDPIFKTKKFIKIAAVLKKNKKIFDWKNYAERLAKKELICPYCGKNILPKQSWHSDDISLNPHFKQASLTNREIRIWNFISQGSALPEIARELGISVFSVRTHKRKIKLKLQAVQNKIEEQKRQKREPEGFTEKDLEFLITTKQRAEVFIKAFRQRYVVGRKAAIAKLNDLNIRLSALPV